MKGSRSWFYSKNSILRHRIAVKARAIQVRVILENVGQGFILKIAHYVIEILVKVGAIWVKYRSFFMGRSI